MTDVSAPGGGAPYRARPWESLALWAALASFGILVGVLALSRNFERRGPGGRWRRTDATGEEVDALLAADDPTDQRPADDEPTDRSAVTAGGAPPRPLP